MITVLGKTFNTDEERREYFRAELRQHLPELKKMEGFPIGEDEDIIALSDPPYYTACPNPWLNDFIAEWEAEKKELERQGKRQPDFEVQEPYASDVSEGKNNPIYNAHSYHTKVPHPAIMRYILHYTQPGDIVYDGFAGTGMTGVAAQLCGKPDAETKYKIEQEFKQQGQEQMVWGHRRAILSDLSPIASFIACNYNTPLDVSVFEEEARRILTEVKEEFGWMYETIHANGKTGQIRFTVWSEVFSCPACAGEIVFFNEAFDAKSKRVKQNFPCPHCTTKLSKTKLEKLFESNFDPLSNSVIRVPKRQPVLIEYEIGGDRYKKVPEKSDIEILKRIENLEYSSKIPIKEIPPMHMTHERARMDQMGVTYFHHFFLTRPRQILGRIWEKAQMVNDGGRLLFFFEQAIWGLSLLNRYRPTGFSQVNQYMSGVYYIASQHAECSPWYILEGKLNRLIKIFNSRKLSTGNATINTGTAANISILDDNVDYIFTDPPFGENIYYADLNFLIESWHKVLTNAKPEAIVDRYKKKTLSDYQNLMRTCFEEYFRVLKPGRWMTVVFSNSSSAVWNSIQTALQRAGFVLANVSAMDKIQGSYRQVTSTTAVKQDLVISCYKPSSQFDQKFRQNQYNDVGVWDFVEEHLHHLPVHLLKDNSTTAIIERSPKILFDRLVAFYVQRSLPVPIDAAKFQKGLKERFVERNGMYFTAEQAAEYDRKKAQAPNFVQAALFVSSEQDGVLFLKNLLEQQPLTYSGIHPHWMQALAGQRKGDIIPELMDILQENFLKDAQGR
ncbi:MAG: hypothetical protein J5I98_00450, partial [Phaeodactylibacter sp.]|nr:hypothetical protein [Phaeodactylibacter sp.]